jgi:hypothetical protein
VTTPDTAASPHALPARIDDKDVSESPEGAIRAHLAQVLASPPFGSSKRCRELLTYLIEKTLAGEVDRLKERSLGEDVFGRVGYEPAEQNLVRVTANELRKRLALFYENQPPGLRIELQRGSYIPTLHVPPAPPPAGELVPIVVPPPAAAPAAPGKRRRLVWAAVPVVAVASLAAAVLCWPRPSAEEAFWQPVLASGKPAVIWHAGWGAVMAPEVRDEVLKHEASKVPFTLAIRPDDVVPVDQITSYGHIYGIATIIADSPPNRSLILL